MKKRNQARHCIKWNKGIGLFLRKWLWFFVASGIIVAIGIIELSDIDAEKEVVQVSEPFHSYYALTPEPSYQMPSELLEHMAVEAEEDIMSWSEEAVYMAKTIYGEARGEYSQTKQAYVAWIILNRVDAGEDAGFKNTIHEVCTQQDQFCYDESFPTVDDYGRDLVELSLDVLERWLAEKRFGTEKSGRVIPKDCYYFWEEEYSLDWNYAMPSPYDT